MLFFLPLPYLKKIPKPHKEISMNDYCKTIFLSTIAIVFLASFAAVCIAEVRRRKDLKNTYKMLFWDLYGKMHSGGRK